MKSGNILTLMVGIIFLLTLFSINVNANLGTFSPSSCVDIKTILNTTSVTLSTVNYPNSTVAISSVPMQQSGLTFNYTFCDTSTIGTYTYDYYDSEGNVFVNDFIINPSGTSLSSGQGMIYLVLLLILLALFGLTLYGALKLKWKHDTTEDGKIVSVRKLRYFKPILFVFAYIELMWISGILYSVASNLLPYDSVSPIFYWVYEIMLYSLIPISFTTLFFCLIVLVQDRKLRKKIFRGYNR